jgi:hypothetical protein
MTYEELESRCQWLEAENAAIKKAVKWAYSRDLWSRFSPVDLQLFLDIDDPEYDFSKEEKVFARLILQVLEDE